MTCTAYNAEELEGTHCLDLATGWAKARGSMNLAKAINTLTNTAVAIMKGTGR